MISKHDNDKRMEKRRGERTVGFALTLLVPLLLPTLLSCMEEFDPPSLLTNLRVLAISAEPADLAPGETAALEALVVEPGGQPVEYAWEWCPFDQGPNNEYACVTEELGLPPEALELFDLGDQPRAVLTYPGDPAMIQQMCQSIREIGDSLPTFIELPDCERGIEVTIRLTVSTPEMDRVAVRDLFVWFIHPDQEERNTNPAIEGIRVDGNRYRPSSPVLAVPGQLLGLEVMVGESSAESYVVQLDGDQREDRREDLIFSFFSTAGEWDRFRSFADLEEFSLDDAGYNILAIPDDILPATEIAMYVVVRDERGGAAWSNQVVQVINP